MGGGGGVGTLRSRIFFVFRGSLSFQEGKTRSDKKCGSAREFFLVFRGFCPSRRARPEVIKNVFPRPPLCAVALAIFFLFFLSLGVFVLQGGQDPK